MQYRQFCLQAPRSHSRIRIALTEGATKCETSKSSSLARGASAQIVSSTIGATRSMKTHDAHRRMQSEVENFSKFVKAGVYPADLPLWHRRSEQPSPTLLRGPAQGR